MLNLDQVSALLALISTAIVLTITIVKQKRLDKNHLGTMGATYFAGYNIPIALFLMHYVFKSDTPEMLASVKLSGLEKHLCFSGAATLIISAATIWTNIQAAYKIEKEK